MEPEISPFFPPDPPGQRLDPERRDLKGLAAGELVALCREMGESDYRGRQLFSWLYHKGAVSFGEMSDLSKGLRERLAGCFRVGALRPERTSRGEDGTEKYAWKLADGALVESVRIPMHRAGERARWALCLSTQVGCAMGCAFCLTARMGFVRQLSAGEIVEQFLAARRLLPEGERFHNVVFMGMGEPLDNFDATVAACHLLTHPDAGGVSARRLTVSTVGLAPRMTEFVRAVPGVGLAVSLHAADDATRGRLVPVNRKWGLDDLLRTCRELPVPERRRITFEYVLLKGVNDSVADARRLAQRLRGIRCKVNLLSWNPFEGAAFERPGGEAVEAFRQILVKAGLTATVRLSKGLDIRAACGQLADDAQVGGRASGRIRRRPATSPA